MSPEEIDALTAARLDELSWLKEFLMAEKLHDPRDARKLAKYISQREKQLESIYEKTQS